MLPSLPESSLEFSDWSWIEIEPYYQELSARTLDAGTVHAWLSDWTRLSDHVSERYARLNVAITTNTMDTEAEAKYHAFLDHIYLPAQAADQKLKEKLLKSNLQPEGFEVPLLRMKVEADLFRSENLPLLSGERKLASEYNKVIGAQTVRWGGAELTLQQLRPVMQNLPRATRQEAWQLAAARQLQDRGAINSLWREFMPLRCKLAENAGMEDYRAYRWQQMLRIDYSPADCLELQQAIEQVVVPAATIVYERQRKRLGVEHLRPWDLDLDIYPIYFPELSSYGTVDELQEIAGQVFHQVGHRFGEYFSTLRQEGLLDLENHKGKAPGAYCTGFPITRRPFIFMNAVGLAGDVRTILHESGHAFHNFERLRLPYAQQRNPGLEFAEVASMAMELLAAPYLSKDTGGLYSRTEARRFLLEHLEHILTFWPYMAVVDAFQHWAYTHSGQALDPDRCDEQWLSLWNRFLPGVDWSGLEQEAMTGWQRKQHIYRYPFYYVEYGLAQLGAVQIWRNALRDQSDAVAAYTHALRLGGTVRLPQLYETAGARLAFDADTLADGVGLIAEKIEELENELLASENAN